MKGRYELRLAGQGGQGLILAGLILAEAAAVYDGKKVVMTQAYDPQQRGGPSRAEIIIGEGEIDYPKVLAADVLLALTQEAFDKHRQEIAPEGIILVDPSLVEVTETEGGRVERIPLCHLAREAVGKELAANMVALGVIVEVTRVVSRRALLAAVGKRSPGKGLKINEMALRKGFEVGKTLRERPRRRRKPRPPVSVEKEVRLIIGEP